MGRWLILNALVFGFFHLLLLFFLCLICCDLFSFDTLGLGDVQDFELGLLLGLLRLCFHLGDHLLALGVTELLRRWLLDFFDLELFSLLRLAVEAFLGRGDRVILLMLADFSCQSKDLVVGVPSEFLYRRQVIRVIVGFLTRSLVHTTGFTGCQGVILRQLLLTLPFLHFLRPALPVLPGFLDLAEVLCLALFTLLLLLLSLLKLFLLPLFSFGSHLGLPLFFELSLLFLFLRALAHHFFLLPPRGLLSCLAPFTLLLLLFCSLPVNSLSFGSDALLCVDSFDILFALAGFLLFAGLDFRL